MTERPFGEYANVCFSCYKAFSCFDLDVSTGDKHNEKECKYCIDETDCKIAGMKNKASKILSDKLFFRECLECGDETTVN